MPDPVPGLNFVLSDGTLDHLKIMVVARTRAVTHSRDYDEDCGLAYQCELQGAYAEADGELQIWTMREIAAGRMKGEPVPEWAARELATDLPLGSVA
jgi:hypothetical protein